MTHPVRRHVVQVDGRAVHLRVLGSGPAAVLLHESPRSSVAVQPLAQALADRFTVYCPDTPGFGLSDPLPLKRPEIEDFADATARLLDVLGLEKPALYGAHTGAEIAMALGLRHPGRVSVVAMEGFPVFTLTEQEEQLRWYLPQFPTRWDGSHMAALWARVRDQLQFYPWYAKGEANRLGYDPRPLEGHDQVVADLMDAGVEAAPNYATGYSAAFRYDGKAAIRAAAEMGAPVVYLCREDDMLHPHLDRTLALVPDAPVRSLTPDRAAWAAAIAEVLADPAAGPAPTPPAQHPDRFFAPGGMLVRRSGPAAGPATLLLHGHPGSGAVLEAEAARAARTGPVYVPDLPGSGHSAALGGEAATLAARMAAAVAEALARVEGPVSVEAWFTGQRVAEALVALDPARFRIAALHDPLPQGEALAALRANHVRELPSDWLGSHMLGAWWLARDMFTYAPWFVRTVATEKPLPSDIDLAALQRHAQAIFQGRATEPAVMRALLA